MIPDVKPRMTLRDVQKIPHISDHYRQQCKIAFINAIVETYNQGNSGVIDLTKSYIDTDTLIWHIEWETEHGARSIGQIVEQVLSLTYFNNFAKNENVYFYRYLNVFLNKFGHRDEILSHLKSTTDTILLGNVMEYVDYRQKTDELANMLGVTNVFETK